MEMDPPDVAPAIVFLLICMGVLSAIGITGIAVAAFLLFT